MFLIFYTTFCYNNENLDSENNVNNEQKIKKRLVDEVEALKKELHKQGFA